MGEKIVRLEDLRVGDVVRVHWFDASEDTRQLAKEEKTFDTPVQSYGAFLGTKGLRTKHAIIAKEIVVCSRTFHYNVIPIGMIEKIVLLNQKDLPENLLDNLAQAVASASIKKLKIGKAGGWFTY